MRQAMSSSPAGSSLQSRRRLLALLALLPLACVLLTLVYAGAASAAALGGRWSFAQGSPLVITYNDTACADPSYQAVIEDAAAQWNSTPTPVAFVRSDSTDPARVRLFVCTGFDDGPDSDYLGVTHLFSTDGSECYTCPIASAAVFLNRSELDQVPAEFRLKTATHELGHVLGLAHPAKSDHRPQIMQQGWHGFFAPQQTDIDNVNGLYAGWSGAKPAAATTALAPLPDAANGGALNDLAIACDCDCGRECGC